LLFFPSSANKPADDSKRIMSSGRDGKVWGNKNDSDVVIMNSSFVRIEGSPG